MIRWKSYRLWYCRRAYYLKTFVTKNCIVMTSFPETFPKEWSRSLNSLRDIKHVNIDRYYVSTTSNLDDVFKSFRVSVMRRK